MAIAWVVYGIVCFLAGFFTKDFIAWTRKEPAVESCDWVAVDEVIEAPKDTEAYKAAAEQYAVDRKPRKAPWHIRKRELEAAARTKRKAREEYR